MSVYQARTNLLISHTVDKFSLSPERAREKVRKGTRESPARQQPRLEGPHRQKLTIGDQLEAGSGWGLNFKFGLIGIRQGAAPVAAASEAFIPIFHS